MLRFLYLDIVVQGHPFGKGGSRITFMYTLVTKVYLWGNFCSYYACGTLKALVNVSCTPTLVLGSNSAKSTLGYLVTHVETVC